MAANHGSSEDGALDMWMPPPKRFALQSSHDLTVGSPSDISSSNDIHTTVLTDPKLLLRHFQPELVQCINLDSLVPYLNQQRLLTDNENETLSSPYITHHFRVQKLLQFIGSKEALGFQLFLEAISMEPEHLGHTELTEIFATYRSQEDVQSSVGSSRPDITGSENPSSENPLHSCQHKLVQCIDLESLVPYLNQQHLLTDKENDTLLNPLLTHHTRVCNLLQFIESKGDNGLLRFLKALSAEPKHLGHKELDKVFTSYRSKLSKKLKNSVPMRSIANSALLQAALEPVSGAESDLQESVEQSCSSSDEARLGSITRKMVELQSAAHVRSTKNTNTGIQVVYHEQLSGSVSIAESIGTQSVNVQGTPETLSQAASQESWDNNYENKLDNVLQNDELEEPSTKIVRKYPNLIFPSGPLKKKSTSLIYVTLFKMAWSDKEDTARSVMTYLRRNKKVPLDTKVMAMEVVHTVNAQRDLKILTSALSYTDKPSCENQTILKCRLHRRIAGLHYRNNDIEEANEHMDTALQLAHNIAPDIDTIYTYRLKALMLFEDYKKTRCKESYKDANKYFTKAMDHARQQPELKQVVTERVKVSKALFHLDTRAEYKKVNEGENILEELEYRARDTLEDVDEEHLTDGDRAFFYMTRAKLFMCSQNWQATREDAQKALDLNHLCGLTARTEQAKDFIDNIPIASKNGP